MIDKQTGGSAFPGFHPPPGCRYQEQGMTLRDYFAAKAMQGFVMDDALHKEASTAKEWLKSIADASYEMADAMLKARDGTADKPADPCPGCRPGVTCRTPSCGRLKLAQANGQP